jgi:hypothetical protein
MTESKKPVRAKSVGPLFRLTLISAGRTVGIQNIFWAFVVWNFDTKAVEILEITQTTIQTALEELINSEEWGDPLGYGITVNRKGDNLETEYSVVPSPAQPTPTDIIRGEAYQVGGFIHRPQSIRRCRRCARGRASVLFSVSNKRRPLSGGVWLCMRVYIWRRYRGWRYFSVKPILLEC